MMISSKQYIGRALQSHGLDSANPVGTPVVASMSAEEVDGSKPAIDETLRFSRPRWTVRWARLSASRREIYICCGRRVAFVISEEPSLAPSRSSADEIQDRGRKGVAAHESDWSRCYR